jgi:hypothetical protein
MSPKRYYISCPVCKTRMIRTGRKIQGQCPIFKDKVCTREYECPSCGLVCRHSETENRTFSGGFDDFEQNVKPFNKSTE